MTPGEGGPQLVRAAARNNTEWCDIVCRLHGQAGSFHDDGWTVPRRSPPFYPDAVTLDPGAGVDGLLATIDSSSGCSIKDSFACLDLAPHGFHELFEAQWICREADMPPLEPPAGMRWDVVREPSALLEWEHAWNEDAIPAGLFRPALLEDDAVTVLAGFRNSAIVAGAIAKRSATVVGISNVFAPANDLDTAWCGSVAAIATLLGEFPIVGYEQRDAIGEALRVGFSQIGPLRVWTKGDPENSGQFPTHSL